jgi:hypothetical protein
VSDALGVLVETVASANSDVAETAEELDSPTLCPAAVWMEVSIELGESSAIPEIAWKTPLDIVPFVDMVDVVPLVSIPPLMVVRGGSRPEKITVSLLLSLTSAEMFTLRPG